MSQIVRSLLELLQRRSYYSGDLLFSTEILRNVTDTFKRATYIPAPDDVQVRRPPPNALLDPRSQRVPMMQEPYTVVSAFVSSAPGNQMAVWMTMLLLLLYHSCLNASFSLCLSLFCVQKFFQIVSLMLDMENVEKWEDAHQVKKSPYVRKHVTLKNRSIKTDDL